MASVLHRRYSRSKPLTSLRFPHTMATRRCLAAGVLLLTVMASNWVLASPNGLGSEANEGCLCHTRDASTVVELRGLPEAFESTQNYNVTLVVSSSLVAVENASQGGFRLLVDEGGLVLDNNSLVQALDGGWTHTTEGSTMRSWNLVWQAPAENDTAATFVVHGNAVNGNNAPTGDAWSTLEVVVPGVAYDGDLVPREGIDGVSQTDRLILAVGLLALVGLLWSVGRP